MIHSLASFDLTTYFNGNVCADCRNRTTSLWLGKNDRNTRAAIAMRCLIDMKVSSALMSGHKEETDYDRPVALPMRF